MLRWFVGQYHVGTPLWEICKDYRKRCYKTALRDDIARDLWKVRRVHLENREVYRHVMGGIDKVSQGEEGRCPHGMFMSGAGGCPECAA